MDLKEAFRRAGAFLKESAGKGYFLCSAFASIKNQRDGIVEWILHLSNGDKALDCYVRDDGISTDESQSVGEPLKLDIGSAKVTETEALSKAEIHSAGAIMVLLSLHGSPPVWTLNFVMQNMSVTTVDVSAETGEITRNEKTSILRK